MKSITKHIASFLVLALCFPIIVPAEDLPSLPAASNIRAGSLPNGVNYYIVQNSSHKGMADIALVQKVGKADEEPRQKGSVTVAARAALTDLAQQSFRISQRKIHPSLLHRFREGRGGSHHIPFRESGAGQEGRYRGLDPASGI